ncbi:hypothetical protein PoB_001433200 [Plakobranchus ocellatus]|uniref:Uncharacterized protein n=1 Tax=Plakobranchus ocellatus TaxID=259542 RepID=A0AAV3YXX1_9GAST|nr:hypothetical protein PoB_001433200 [Plakobranchus ocellatus]
MKVGTSVSRKKFECGSKTYKTKRTANWWDLKLEMWKIVVGALWLCLAQAASQSAPSCFDDVNSCLPAFRNRYLDVDYFWFGTSYFMCPMVCI